MKILFKNGWIVDGTGEKPYQGDVLTEDDRIVSVGGSISADADKVLDITDCQICPGFIDAHSHNDFFCDREDAEKFFRPFMEQGITTQITGNCSFSVFGMDADSPHMKELGGGLFSVLRPGSFASFKERQKGNLYVNIAPLVGNGSVRAGMTGYDPTPLSKEQIQKEMEYVEEAMQGGALGGSYGFMYEPNRYAQPDELLAFAETIAKYDGIVTVHPRACAIISADYPLFSKKSHLELGLDEVVDIMKKAKCRLEYSHLIFTGSRSWKLLDKMLTSFHKTREEGWDIAYDNYAFHYGASVITVVFPAWYAALSKEEAAKPSNKRKLAFTIFLYRKLFGIDWDDLVVAYISDEHRDYEGKTVLDCAREEGIKPLDMYLKLVELSDRKGSIYLGKYYNDAIVRRLMEDDLSVFMTDAWVEDKGLQNIAAYQTFPQFFVLARKYGIPVEKIVRKMTGATVDRFHIAERGYLKEGYKADITVIDASHMKVNEKVPDAKPEGISHVMVNGRLVVENGAFIGGKAGEIILRADVQPSPARP